MQIGLFLLCLVLFLSSACTSTTNVRQEKNASFRVKEFSDINDRNERAFFYHQHCLRKTEPMNEQFMENFQTVADLLFDEIVAKFNWTPEYTLEQILRRRQHIKQTLNHYYVTKGCQSEEAMDSRRHYRAFSLSVYTEGMLK